MCQEYWFCLNPVRKVNNKVCVSRVSILSEPVKKVNNKVWHTYFIVYFLDWFRQNRYSWHTYFIVYFPDWVQTKSILLTHILYCLLSWLVQTKSILLTHILYGCYILDLDWYFVFHSMWKHCCLLYLIQWSQCLCRFFSVHTKWYTWLET
jgi:hypothetical protein